MAIKPSGIFWLRTGCFGYRRQRGYRRLVGRTLSFRNAGAFCAIVNGSRPIGYNDNAAKVAECRACIGETSTPWTAPANSLFRISNGRTSTIGELQDELGMRR